jgi:hypothetical protein
LDENSAFFLLRAIAYLSNGGVSVGRVSWAGGSTPSARPARPPRVHTEQPTATTTSTTLYTAIGSPWVQTPRHGDPIATQ